LDNNNPNYLEKNYDLLAGTYPKGMNDVALIVDKKNSIDKTLLQSFGLQYSGENVPFDNIIGYEFRAILNNNFYREDGSIFTINGDPLNLIDMYNNDRAVKLKVAGILRPKRTVKFSLVPEGFAYSDELCEFLLKDASKSDIVLKQMNSDYNVLTGEAFDTESPEDDAIYKTVMSALGASSMPSMIWIYPTNFDAKEKILAYLDRYNDGKAEKDKIIYNDLAAKVTDLTGGIMNAITLVLIAFSSVSLIVSLIMVGIITYISVLERTREIGVLRALGARKKDIARVFNAETFIIGLCSGVLGIIIARLLIFPINHIIKNRTELTNVAQLNPVHAISLILISLILTVLGGAIPAKIAAKKDPVEALRAE
jgi:ABC-type antimicrobial peptide transport system permease subunit